MQLTFLGAAREVTGSRYFLEACGKKILVDYGMEQGANVFENTPLPVAASAVDYVFLTHDESFQPFSGAQIDDAVEELLEERRNVHSDPPF